MAIADNGASVGGIGAGLLAFTDTYLKTKQMNNSNALNQRYADMANQKEKAGLLEKGMVASPTGDVSFDDVHQKLHDQEAQNYLSESEYNAEKLKPGSAAKSPVGGLYKSVMNRFQPGETAADGTQGPGLGDQMINENTKLADLDQIKGPVGNMFAGFNADKRMEALLEAEDSKSKDRLSQQQNMADIAEKRNQSAERRAQMAQDAAAQKAEGLQKQKDQASEEKYQKNKTVNLKSIGPMNASIRTGTGSAQDQLNRIDRLKQLLANGNNLNQQQTEELAIGLQRVLGSGTGNGTQVQQLLPRSAQGDAEKLMSYFQNNPNLLNQQKFVKPMADLLNREQSTIKGQLKGWQYPQLYAIENQIKEHENGPNGTPGEWNEALKMNGVDPADYARFRQSGQIEAPEPVVPRARATAAPKSQYEQGKVYTLPDGNQYLYKGGSSKNKDNWVQQNGISGLLNKGKGLLGL